MSLSASLSPLVSPLRTQILSSPIIKTIKHSFSSPFGETKNDNSPIFKMSPLTSIKIAELIDIASSYGATTENKIDLPPLPLLSSTSSTLSISPHKIDIVPLPSLSTMKNSLYERRMKNKEQQVKEE